MYRIHATKSYRKALKRLRKNKNFVEQRLDEVIDILAVGEVLPRGYLDHPLNGEYGNLRECHIQNDILLLYQVEKGVLVLSLVNLGTHSKLFKK